MSYGLIFLWVVFFAAILLRASAAFFEARYLRFSWDYFCRPSDDDDDRSVDREDLLERIGAGLSAARLARLLAVIMITPSTLLIAQLWSPIADIDILPSRPFLSDLLLLLIIASVLSILFSVIHASFMVGFYDPKRPSTRSRMPQWLFNKSNYPAPAALGGITWDWMIRGGEWLSRVTRLERPTAYLYESEEGMLMAVGEQEMGALGAKTSEEPDEKAKDAQMELEMIRRIQRLDETLVREVMRPLNNVTALLLPTLTPEKFLAIARRTGYTRFPVYEDQVTDLIGYLNIYDILDSEDQTIDLRSLVIVPPYIPEVAHLDVALQEMLRLKSQVMICFDEFGGCSGMLTREDIIEEITGEIMDEYDRKEEVKLTVRRNHYLAEGTLDLDDLAEATDLELEKVNCDTLSGFIYHRLNRVPRRGEHLEIDGWRIEVIQMDRHRIKKVRLTPPEGVEVRLSGMIQT